MPVLKLSRCPALCLQLCACCLFVAAGVNTAWAQTEEAAAAPLRTWHAATGGFKVEAELVDVRESKVQLRKADGSSLWVPLERLSLADVKFIQAELAKARQSLNDSAKSEDSSSAKAKPTRPANRAEAKEPGNTPADESAEKPADMPMEDGDGAAATSEDGADGDSSSKLAGRSAFAGMRSCNLVLGQISSHDLVFPQVLSPWLVVRKHVRATTMYQLVNIRTGRWGEPFPVEGHSNQIALSPDGTTLAVASVFPPKIMLYATSSGKKGKEITFPEASGMTAMIFPTSQQLLTTGGMRMPAAIYDVKTGKQLKTIDMENNFSQKFAVSPDGKLLAVPGHSLVTIYDLKLGKRKDQLAVVPKSGSGSISIEDLAFLNDGAELAVIGGLSTGEFQVFSMKNGRAIVKHTLSERASSFAQSSQYRGPAIEAIPGNKGYILYGCAIVDRDNGGPVWVDKAVSGEPASEFRVLIDDQRQLMLTGQYNAKRFEIVDLPWSDISKSKDMVAKGGTVEDAGLPTVKIVSAKVAKPVEKNLNLRAFNGKKVTPPEPLRARAIPIDQTLGMLHNVRFAAPSTGKCMSLPSLFNANKKREALLFDLKAGKLERSVPVDFLAQVTDFSPGGKWLVGTSGKNQDRLDIFNLETGKHEVGFRPNSSEEGTMGPRMASAVFLSDELLITHVPGSEAVVWQIPELQAVYKFSTMSSIFRFPSSPLFLHRNEQGWCVRSVKDGKPEGMLEGTDNVGNEFLRTIHFRADESACVGISGMGNDQRLIAWDLLTGQRIADISLSRMPNSRDAMRDFGNPSADGKKARAWDDSVLSKADSVMWAGDGQVLLRWMQNDTQRFSDKSNVSPTVYSLYSLTEKRALWDYRMPTGIALEGGPEGQIWFGETTKGNHALVGVQVPTELSKAEIAKAPEPKPLLGPNESVKVELKVVVSGDKLADGLLQDQVSTLVEQRLAAKKVGVSERAAVKLTVTVERVFVNETAFRREGSAKLMAICRLTDISDNVLWQREKIIDEQKSNDDGKPQLAENVRRLQWSNALAWLGETIDPQTMVDKWYYRGVGESLVSSTGEKLIEVWAKP